MFTTLKYRSGHPVTGCESATEAPKHADCSDLLVLVLRPAHHEMSSIASAAAARAAITLTKTSRDSRRRSKLVKACLRSVSALASYHGATTRSAPQSRRQDLQILVVDSSTARHDDVTNALINFILIHLLVL